MKGTVTISLEDYNKLVDSGKDTKNKEEYLRESAKELSVFLSFLAKRENIDRHVEAFNLQSTTSKIVFKGNRALIEFRNEINN